MISPMATRIALLVSIYALMALLAGWVFGVEALIRHHQTQSAMVPSTTLSFVFAAGALITASMQLRTLTQLQSALVIVLVGVTTLAQVSGWQELASLLFFEIGETERMAPVTAIGFILVVFAINRLQANAFTLVNSIGIFGLSVAFSATLLKFGAATGISELRIFAGMSLQTSTVFCLLFLAMCLTTFEDRNG